MKRLIVASALLLAACSNAGGTADVQVSDAWARETVAGQTSAAAYMTLTNRGSADDRLVSIAAAPPTMAMLHETSTEDGVSRMRHLEDGVVLPAGGTVALKPGGAHIMLTGLAASLKSGAEIELKLRFEKSAERSVSVRVAGAAER